MTVTVFLRLLTCSVCRHAHGPLLSLWANVFSYYSTASFTPFAVVAVIVALVVKCL